jgi:hypothetical protein
MMKWYFLTLFFVFILFAGCGSPDAPAIPAEGNGKLTETALPKGKYIIEDEIKPVNSDVTNGASINGYDKTGGTGDKPSGTTDTPADKKDNLKRRYKNLLVFHADDTMKIKKSYIATLILGKDQVLGSLEEEVLTSSNAKSENIKYDTTIDIGSKMRARLIDMSGATNKGFDIELIGGDGAAEQRIPDKRKKAIWNWKLTPQTPGQQELKLAVTIIEKDGEAITLPTTNIPVIIFAEKESFFAAVGGIFKGENIKWILSAILIPIFVAWVTSKIKYKHENQRPAPRTRNRDNQNDNSVSHQTGPSSQSVDGSD